MRKFSTSSSENEIISPSSKNVTSGIISTSVCVCANATPVLVNTIPTTEA